MSSMMPLMAMGATMAHNSSFLPSRLLWLRRYSHHRTQQKPPYISVWTHLSKSGISLASLMCGGRKSDRYHISAMMAREKLYFRMCFCIFNLSSLKMLQKYGIFSNFATKTHPISVKDDF